MTDRENMMAAVKRLETAMHEPRTYFFEDEQVRAAVAAVEKAGDAPVRLYVRLGLGVDGQRHAWLEVREMKTGTTLLAANISHSCPPLPPEVCE